MEQVVAHGAALAAALAAAAALTAAATAAPTAATARRPTTCSPSTRVWLDSSKTWPRCLSTSSASTCGSSARPWWRKATRTATFSAASHRARRCRRTPTLYRSAARSVAAWTARTTTTAYWRWRRTLWRRLRRRPRRARRCRARLAWRRCAGCGARRRCPRAALSSARWRRFGCRCSRSSPRTRATMRMRTWLRASRTSFRRLSGT
mmetsp:Transcript_1039/g.3815  ORF Transcript_1039/g.3815 Transcript_1039/m.3815 type:complete len:206 (-) Transcript_1039:4642-5259(-)